MTLGGRDLLMYIQSIEREKDLPFEQVLDIFAESLAQSARRSGNDVRDGEFRVSINPESGDIKTFRCWRVLADDELMENPQAELMLGSAQEIREDAKPGDIVEKPFDNKLLEIRSCIHSAKQHFNLRLRDAERKRLLDELLARDEQLVGGQVLRILRDTGDAVVEVMRLECRLPKNQMIPREAIKSGDRLQALIKEVNPDAPGQAVMLTRTSPEFLKLLFKRVVPEIEKGILEIIGAVRDPGNRAKISVRSHDARVDPVGTCVGIRGSRVQTVTNELNGERVDIIPWEDDPAKMVLRALAPAEISRIEVDEGRRAMDVLVAPDRIAQAIGKNGVNIRLASELSGWKLNLHSIAEYEAEVQEKMRQRSEMLARALNLEEDAARILQEEGFDTLEHVAFAEAEELAEVSGLQPEAVSELQTRARALVEKEEAEMAQKMEKMEAALSELIQDNELLQSLAKNDILTLSDFADLSADELLDIDAGVGDKAGDYIMRARDLVFGDGEDQEAAAGS
ncbi:MAG: transcription termination/antitermination protein NusA [Betaproteobacteria bacterium]|nr:transcription termination/antitermination protein NusA [Betaproteobacteria bacterium]